MARYCELKEQRDKLDEELENLREELIAAHAESCELRIGEYTLKILYQEKRKYMEQQLFDALPDPSLWKHVSKPDGAKISALVRANVLPEKLLQGTYEIVRMPYVYVQK